ncbi:hypothetical protein ABW20_dc0102730 [Dactylellina cionopaga]|nr:hypothetical protein ABW20_dc0102730 [Dactylellina cionopaga]
MFSQISIIYGLLFAASVSNALYLPKRNVSAVSTTSSAAAAAVRRDPDFEFDALHYIAKRAEIDAATTTSLASNLTITSSGVTSTSLAATTSTSSDATSTSSTESEATDRATPMDTPSGPLGILNRLANIVGRAVGPELPYSETKKE